MKSLTLHDFLKLFFVFKFYFLQVFFLKILILYFWLCQVFIAAQGLSLVVESRGYSLVAVHGVLFVVASLVEDKFQAHALQQLQHPGSVVVVTWAQVPGGMWNLPRPGSEPMSSTLAGRFLSTVPPQKSLTLHDFQDFCHILILYFSKNIIFFLKICLPSQVVLITCFYFQWLYEKDCCDVAHCVTQLAWFVSPFN